MKTQIGDLLNAVVNDNYDYIKEEGETIAHWILLNAREENFGWYFFLNSDEIEEFENDKTRQTELITEIEEYVINNYAYKL